MSRVALHRRLTGWLLAGSLFLLSSGAALQLHLLSAAPVGKDSAFCHLGLSGGTCLTDRPADDAADESRGGGSDPRHDPSTCPVCIAVHWSGKAVPVPATSAFHMDHPLRMEHIHSSDAIVASAFLPHRAPRAPPVLI
jgi:hypothetical protein